MKKQNPNKKKSSAKKRRCVSKFQEYFVKFDFQMPFLVFRLWKAPWRMFILWTHQHFVGKFRSFGRQYIKWPILGIRVRDCYFLSIQVPARQNNPFAAFKEIESMKLYQNSYLTWLIMGDFNWDKTSLLENHNLGLYWSENKADKPIPTQQRQLAWFQNLQKVFWFICQ